MCLQLINLNLIDFDKIRFILTISNKIFTLNDVICEHHCIADPESNAMEWNGMQWNAMECNGMQWNAMQCKAMQ
jgi:hypothetical protein